MNADIFSTIVMLFAADPEWVQFATLGVSIFAAAFGFLCSLLLRGFRNDLDRLREKTEKNSEDIRGIQTRCDTIQGLKCKYPSPEGRS